MLFFISFLFYTESVDFYVNDIILFRMTSVFYWLAIYTKSPIVRSANVISDDYKH
jgi:hypothetical protein